MDKIMHPGPLMGQRCIDRPPFWNHPVFYVKRPRPIGHQKTLPENVFKKSSRIIKMVLIYHQIQGNVMLMFFHFPLRKEYGRIQKMILEITQIYATKLDGLDGRHIYI